MSMTMTASGADIERSPWRWPAAASAVVLAAAHLPITPEHLSEAPYIGTSFVALEIAGAVLAVALLLWDTRPVWGAAVVVPAAAVAAYLVTRSFALPQIPDDKGNWTEPLSFVALASEVLLIVLAAAHRHPSLERSRLVAHPGTAAAAILVVGLAATVWAASASMG